MLNRRTFHRSIALTVAAGLAPELFAREANQAGFRPNYILASCMYGYAKLETILPETHKTGAAAIDLWPKVHGDQREQLAAMGEAKFKELLAANKTKLGCITQYKLGPFGLKDELGLAQRLGCHLIVTGGKGPAGLRGQELKIAVKKFAEQMKPHLAIAQKAGVTIAIENHGNNLIQSADSMKWLMEFSGPSLGIALAPYHLPQDSKQLANLIIELGNRIKMFYAWQHGMGCSKKLPKAQELLQMPGRGELDFGPLVDALSKSKYAGWTEIFMHPVPRGIPILDGIDKVTAEINRSRKYLNELMK